MNRALHYLMLNNHQSLVESFTCFWTVVVLLRIDFSYLVLHISEDDTFQIWIYSVKFYLDDGPWPLIYLPGNSIAELQVCLCFKGH